MNSKERHEARYQRRKAKREARKAELRQQYGNFASVFTFDNLYDSYQKACRGVGWKASTQKFKVNALYNINQIHRQLLAGKFKSKGFHEFDIYERGKPRHIKSLHISERVVQRCLCDNALVPMYSNSFIYDNGASMKGKGIDFAIRRLTCHLQRHYRKYGCEGYALIFDFSKYFDNIAHEPLIKEVYKRFDDERLRALIVQLIKDFGDKGLGLGSQISQVSALMYPNKLDHYIKEVLHIKGYGRYMDDGYLIHHSKEHLQICLAEIKRICGELGIILNTKKTQIVKLSRGITFLKTRFFLTETGKVVKKPCRQGVVRMRRKLKKFKQWLIGGKFTMKEIRTSVCSWLGHVKRCNSYKTRQSMRALYRDLFLKKEVKANDG
ncbi:MAG: reverse transcriptase domain-containing protein [Christensenellales bacterium]